jgi:hypothetical protein
MCPIHETDSGEERWSQSEWEHYELWEKLEARARKVRRAWLVLGFMMFLGLSAIPIVVERKPEWKALQALRELGQQMNRLKREAAQRQEAFRLRIVPTAPLTMQVEWAHSCESEKFEVERSIELLAGDPLREELSWVSADRAKSFAVAGLLSTWCYDPLSGSQQTQGISDVAGFLMASAKDLAASGSAVPDRYAVLLLTGPSAEISFQ